MKFEMPKMNISLFAKEDIVTESASTPEVVTAETKAMEAFGGKGVTQTVKLTF